ncbi:MAG: hypothetical protein HWE11_13945 [Gammaproteobacteria bacterium]|nr:hypothetical protein [Gammaproteobacteria bacterium]
MKFSYLTLMAIFLSISVNVIAESPEIKAVQLMNEAKQAINTNLDSAEELIELALELAPNNSEIQFMCGRIMGRQAEDAVFSALSYAKKSKQCLKQAVALNPQNIEFRKGLMSFYLGAPAIAGGDNDLAWEQVNLINQIDPLKGTSARIRYFQKVEDIASLSKLLEQSRVSFPEYAEFHYRHGLYLQELELFEKANEAFVKATEAKNDDEHNYILNAWYQIGRTAIFSSKNLERGISAISYFINNTPKDSSIPPIDWAHLRLAQLYLLSGQSQQSSEQLSIIANTNDKALQREIRRLKRKL